jgi:arsenic resistance protein ArsH
MKAQIDWIPLSEGAVRPSQGKTLAVMQVCGGSQSFNAVNQMRILGRWMRMFTIPNQSSVAKAWQEFDENGRMKPSSWYDRIVDVAEELFKITLLLKGQPDYLRSFRKKRAISFHPVSIRTKYNVCSSLIHTARSSTTASNVGINLFFGFKHSTNRSISPYCFT